MLDAIQAAKFLGIGGSTFKFYLQGRYKSKIADIVSILKPTVVNRKYMYKLEELQIVKKQLDELAQKVCKYDKCKKPFQALDPKVSYCCKTCQRKADRENTIKRMRINAQKRSGGVTDKNKGQSTSERRPSAYNFFETGHVNPYAYQPKSDYKTGQQTVETQHLCGCGKPANPFTKLCTSCQVKRKYKSSGFIPMKGI